MKTRIYTIGFDTPVRGKVKENSFVFCIDGTSRRLLDENSIIADNTRERQEYIIARSLETPEGRVALAQAMVEPLRRSIDYQGVGRSLLMTDEFPQGFYAIYEANTNTAEYAMSTGVEVPINRNATTGELINFTTEIFVVNTDEDVEGLVDNPNVFCVNFLSYLRRRRTPAEYGVRGDEILTPTFEIAANPTINLTEIRGRRFSIIDRNQILSDEDRAIFRSIDVIMDNSRAIRFPIFDFVEVN